MQINLNQLAEAFEALAQSFADIFKCLKNAIEQLIGMKKHNDQKEECRKGWITRVIIKLKQFNIIRKPLKRARANL